MVDLIVLYEALSTKRNEPKSAVCINRQLVVVALLLEFDGIGIATLTDGHR